MLLLLIVVLSVRVLFREDSRTSLELTVELVIVSPMRRDPITVELVMSDAFNVDRSTTDDPTDVFVAVVFSIVLLLMIDLSTLLWLMMLPELLRPDATESVIVEFKTTLLLIVLSLIVLLSTVEFRI